MVRFSVIMPTYNQGMFIRRAIKSLFDQTYPYWELIIINDGCTDYTEEYISDYLSDDRITYIRYEENQGLGYAINQGIDKAKYDYITYLPSDDFFYENHLESIKEEFERSDAIFLTYTIADSQKSDSFFSSSTKVMSNGLFNSYPLQLVQTAHKKTSERWVTREEFVSEDLYELFWHKLTNKGKFTAITKKTCYWTNHLFQHHKIISESFNGGLNVYRQYYNVHTPLKIKLSNLKMIDEGEIYRNYRGPKKQLSEKPLKILLVGELAYNPERIYALEEQGHILYGLWMNRPTFYFSTVGPLPFGHVIDIPYDRWETEIDKIKPDIIYATLNFGAVPIAHEVLRKKPEIPFVWHFKEGPFFCMQYGTWEKLIELYDRADGKIYLNPEIKSWYEQFYPEKGLSFIMDGDLPKKDCFKGEFSKCLSDSDGGVHTVIPGRAIGLTPADIKLLAQHNIHIHNYVENSHPGKDYFYKAAQKAAPNHFHLHPHCHTEKWVEEFSKYDAGWLHCFDSQNQGKIEWAGWDDLNLPARMNTLAVAGLPMIQKRNQGHIVAMKSRIEKDNLGLFFDTFDELAIQLKNKKRMEEIRQNIIAKREQFSFDYYVPDLIRFFRKVIHHKNKKNK